MNYLKIIVILSAVALFLLGCTKTATNNVITDAGNPNTAADSNSAAPAQTAQPANELVSAREIYVTSCSNCHKEDGSGGKVEIDGKTFKADSLITDKMKNMSDEKYIKYIENGIPDEGMPAFKGKLTDQQIKDVVLYVRRELQKK